MVLPFSVACHWDDAANWPLTTSRYCGGAGLYSLTITQSCASHRGRPSALRTAKIPASAPSLSCSTHQPVGSALQVNCCKTRITEVVWLTADGSRRLRTAAKPAQRPTDPTRLPAKKP